MKSKGGSGEFMVWGSQVSFFNDALEARYSCSILARTWRGIGTFQVPPVSNTNGKRQRVTIDVENLKHYPGIQPPLLLTYKLLSFSSGIVGAPTINCNMAREISLIITN